MSLIHEQIKAARRAAGLTQAELATILGVSAPTVVKYENGTISPSANQLEKIMAACNWSISFSANPNERQHFTIGGRIRHERKSAGLSQAELAESIRTLRGLVGRLETGLCEPGQAERSAMLPARGYQDPSQILNAVESERERQGLSRRELAIKAGLSPSTFQAIVERNRGINLALLLPILYVLGYELQIVPKHNN